MRRAYAGLWLALLGCNPTGGLADSADAALPQTKRYFDGRGSLVSEGPWSRVVVDLDAETLYHVGARRLDDAEPTFHLFGADAREGCRVTPNAGTWLMGKPPPAPFRVLPFLESMDARGRGRLRFTQLDCTLQDLVVEDAGPPYPRLFNHGYLVPTKDGLTFADPWAGTQEEIAANLQSVLVWNDVVLLWGDDELMSFSNQLDHGARWGSGIVAVVPIKKDFLVEDADGLHRVTFDRETLGFDHEDVLPGACHLQKSGITSSDAKSAWVVAQQPCDNPRPTLLQLDAKTFETLSSFELPFEADARYARPLVTGVDNDADGFDDTNGQDDGEPKPLGAVYLTDPDDDGFGTLWAWRADADADADADAPRKLGEHANLDSVSLAAPGRAWEGSAQINYQSLGDYRASDLLGFRWDGATQIVAERVLRNTASGELLVNFDGVAADLPHFTGDSYDVLVEGVPPYAGQATSYTGTPHYARVDHFDGDAGRLRLGTHADNPTSWSAIGQAVPPELVRFAWFMPALIFIEHWDAKSQTGALVAYNYELEARATIAEGVSSFDLTSYPWDGVVYSVPTGKQRGIWFSKAK